MSALEQEIIEKLMQLDEPARRRIIQLVETTWTEEANQPSPWDAWLYTAQALRAEIQAKYGHHTGIDVTALVREVREED